MAATEEEAERAFFFFGRGEDAADEAEDKDNSEIHKNLEH